MITSKSLTAIGAMTALMGASLLTPLTAHASEEGKRNTTLGLGAGAAALLLTQKNKLPGALVGAGAIYSGIQLQNDINRRHRRARDLAAYRAQQRHEAALRAHRRYVHHHD